MRMVMVLSIYKYTCCPFQNKLVSSIKIKVMTIQEIKEQIQQDILTYLDGMDQETLDTLCQIVVNNFNQLKS